MTAVTTTQNDLVMGFDHHLRCPGCTTHDLLLFAVGRCLKQDKHYQTFERSSWLVILRVSGRSGHSSMSFLAAFEDYDFTTGERQKTLAKRWSLHSVESSTKLLKGRESPLESTNFNEVLDTINTLMVSEVSISPLRTLTGRLSSWQALVVRNHQFLPRFSGDIM